MNFLNELGIAEVNPGSCTGPGQWSNGTDAGVLSSYAPATGEIIASVYESTVTDYEAVLERSRSAFHEWRQVPAPRRGQLIRRLADALCTHQEALSGLIALESGKIKAEAQGEVQEMIDIAELAVGQSRMLYGCTMHSERPRYRLYEQWHPLGVVGVITAFNFPVAVWAWNAFIAAVAGNTVIWKPSPRTPLSAVAVQRLCNRVMEEAGYSGIFSLFVTRDNELAERLVRDRRVPLISFTGSTAVGRRVGEIVAARLGRSLLELSGNNAVIVDESADLDLAVRAIVFGAVGTAGQRCTSTRRLIVHESLYQTIVEHLIAAYRQIRIGLPLDPEVVMGPLISGEAVAAFSRALREAEESGGEVLYGGQVIEGLGNYVQPTLVRAQNHWPVVQRETFAPILYLMTFKEIEDAIAINNDAPQGLSSALFTNDLCRAERYLAAAGSDCGIANVNVGTSGAEIGGAFGGEKDTGGGREAGSDAWKCYMRRQTNTINWGTELPLAQGIRFGTGHRERVSRP